MKSACVAHQADQQSLKLHEDIANAAEVTRQVATRLHDAGNLSDLDLAEQSSMAGMVRIELADARTRAETSRENLNRLMGVNDAQAKWTLTGALPDLPSTEPDVAALEQFALLARPDLQAAAADMLVQARSLGLMRSSRWIGTATIGPDFEHETDGQWRIGPDLSIPLPIFDWGQAALPRAQDLYRQSQDRYLAQRADAQSDVRMAHAMLIGARTKVLAYRDDVLPQQAAVLQQTQLRYNGMLTGILQLLQAKRDQIEAQEKSVQALRDYWIARAELERVVGGKFPPMNASTRPSTSGVSR